MEIACSLGVNVSLLDDGFQYLGFSLKPNGYKSLLIVKLENQLTVVPLMDLIINSIVSGFLSFIELLFNGCPSSNFPKKSSVRSAQSFLASCPSQHLYLLDAQSSKFTKESSGRSTQSFLASCGLERNQILNSIWPIWRY